MPREERHGFPVMTFDPESSKGRSADNSEVDGQLYLLGSLACTSEGCNGRVAVNSKSYFLPAHCDECGAAYTPVSVTLKRVPALYPEQAAEQRKCVHGYW